MQNINSGFKFKDSGLIINIFELWWPFVLTNQKSVLKRNTQVLSNMAAPMYKLFIKFKFTEKMSLMGVKPVVEVKVSQ